MRKQIASFAAAIAAVVAADAGEVPPALLQKAECMLQVLKTVPGVSNPKLKIEASKEWSYPILSYEPDEKARWIEPTSFYPDKPKDPAHGPYLFEAVVPGVLAEGEKNIDIHVTLAVVDKWRIQCGVETSVVSD